MSSDLPWSASVTDSLGVPLASGAGVGPTVDWTWDASLAAGAGRHWRIAVAGATPITGVLGQLSPGTALAITGLAADPETISPNDDDQLETSTIHYTTTAAATVTIGFSTPPASNWAS